MVLSLSVNGITYSVSTVVTDRRGYNSLQPQAYSSDTPTSRGEKIMNFFHLNFFVYGIFTPEWLENAPKYAFLDPKIKNRLSRKGLLPPQTPYPVLRGHPLPMIWEGTPPPRTTT